MPRYRITAIRTHEPGGVIEEFDESFQDAAAASQALSAREWLVTSLVEIPEPAHEAVTTPATSQRDHRGDLLAFFGPNAERYLAAMDRMDAGRRRVHWPAFFVGPIWAFYRKLYVEGLVLIIVPIALLFVWPELSVASSAFGVAYGLLANGYYINRARRKIAAIDAADLPPGERTAMIVAAGGASPVSCILAIVALVGFVGAAIYAEHAAGSRVPACASRDTVNLVERILREIGVTGDVRVTRISENVGQRTAQVRWCAAIVVTGSTERVIGYTVAWEDRAARRFRVEIAR